MAITKIPAAGFTGNNFRNIIINGDMSIAHRGTSTASITSNGYYTVDRFDIDLNTLGTWTQSQSTDVPTGQGFAKSLKFDCTTANASPAAGDKLFLEQAIEGQNLQYLKKGTSSAESLTLSFWVKTNKTGIYTLELEDKDNTRSFSQTYTVSSADTWEKKTLTYAGDTTGAFDNDNGASLKCNFWLGAGSDFTSGTFQNSWGSKIAANRVSSSQVNLADNTANEWYITGVQLEAGTTASDFEFLPYDVNLQRCQRYYQVLADGDDQAFGMATYFDSTTLYSSQQLFIPMRTTPTIDITTGTAYYVFARNSGSDTFDSFFLQNRTHKNYIEFLNNTQVSGTGGDAGFLRTDNASAFVGMDAEL